MALTVEDADEAAEEATAEHWLRKKVVAVAKKKKAISSSSLVDPSKDIYLVTFYVGASFEMLGDPNQLEAWWKKKNESQKLIKDAQKTLATEQERYNYWICILEAI